MQTEGDPRFKGPVARKCEKTLGWKLQLGSEARTEYFGQTPDFLGILASLFVKFRLE